VDLSTLTVARALVFLTLLPAAGLPLYWLTAGRDETPGGSARRAAAALAVLAGLASLLWLVASVAAMAAIPIVELDSDTLVVVAGATPLGMVLTIRLAALAVVAASILPARVPLAVPMLAGLVALATCAFTGHAGASEGSAGLVHRLSDVAHLAAAACWLAALLRFVAGAFGHEPAAEAARRLARFATTGTAIVLVLLATGLANLVLIAGWQLPPASFWTALLVFKLALFAAMLGLAALNRWRFTPALHTGAPGAAAVLRRSLAAELACAVALLGVVALLGTLDPAGG